MKVEFLRFVSGTSVDLTTQLADDEWCVANVERMGWDIFRGDRGASANELAAARLEGGDQ